MALASITAARTLNTADTERYYAEHASARTRLLITSCLGAMIGPLSLTTVNLALPSIALAFNAEATTVSWIAMSFLLSSVMFMLPAGKLADIYGRRRFMMLGVSLSVVLSILASCVPSAEWLIVVRFLQGFSMAIIFGSGMAILVAVFAKENRGFAMGMYSSSVYFSLTAAPVLGGLVTEYLGWRAVFWINLPLSVTVLSLFIFAVPGEWRAEGSKRFDWTGSLIFAAWAGAFVYGVSGLPNMASIVTLVISVGYLCLFFWHQSRIATPLISTRLFTHNRIFAFSLGASSLLYSVNYPMGFLLSIFLQLGKGLSPSQAGLVMLVQACTMAIIAPIAGRISDKVEPRIVATLGALCCVLGYGLIFLVSNFSSAWYIGIGLVCVGFGFGFFSTPNNSAAMGAVSKNDLGTASAAVNLARTVGNLTGMSLIALVIQAMIGEQTFTPELNQELLQTVHIWMLIAVTFGFVAATLSFARGKLRQDN